VDAGPEHLTLLLCRSAWRRSLSLPAVRSVARQPAVSPKAAFGRTPRWSLASPLGPRQILPRAERV